MTILFQAQEIDVRSDIHDLGEESVSWDCYTFPGFYYDIDNDIGTENLTFMLFNIAEDESRATLSDQPDAHDNRGIVYTTEAKLVDFSFGQWGQYEEIGFIGRDYFAAYDGNVISDLNATNPVDSVPILRRPFQTPVGVPGDVLHGGDPTKEIQCDGPYADPIDSSHERVAHLMQGHTGKEKYSKGAEYNHLTCIGSVEPNPYGIPNIGWLRYPNPTPTYTMIARKVQ